MVERDETTMRQYLLGELSEAEMSHVEERLMTEGDLFEMLEMVEDDLFDERLDERLSSDERHHFDTYFLSTPARRERLELEQSLRDYANPKPNPKLHKVAASGDSSESAATTDATTDPTSSSKTTEPDNEDPSPPAQVIRPARWWSSPAYINYLRPRAVAHH